MTYDVQTPAAARLWHYAPDWGGGFNVKRSFETDVMQSRNNTEQRRALRTNPRMAAEYRTVVQEAELRDANRWLRAWQNKPTVIPDFARWTRLTGASSILDDTLTVSPLPPWAVAGQRLVLCGAVTEEVLVESVAGSTITLVAPLTAAWGIGAVLRPTFFGMFEGRLSSSRLNKGAAEISVSIASYPGGEPARAVGTAWATFNSREVFTLQPDYSGSPNVGYLWPSDSVDYDRGRTAQFRPIDRAERLTEAEFNGLDLTTAGQVEQFFDRMNGRRGAFYMPTWEKDFDLVEAELSGSTGFLTSGPDLADDFGAIDYAEVDEAIVICLTDGTHIYRSVTDIDEEGGDTRVTVNAAWGVALNAANVARISWLPLWRFASDEMTTSWKSPLNANVRLPFQSVKS